MSILIKGAMLDSKKKDIYIEDNLISEIKDRINVEAEHKIDGKDKAAIPSFVNGHTHAAMTLLRGYAEDMELNDWLEKKIWPTEARMSKKDIYHGSKFACLEMIKTGTTFFNDMYWEPEQTIKAAQEMGMRSSIGLTMIDFDKRGSKDNISKTLGKIKFDKSLTSLNIGPHAIYTVNKENFIWASEFAKENDIVLHIHLSETRKEVEDCIKNNGMRPVEYLDRLGVLGNNVVAAHSVWLDDKEIDILAKRDVAVVHNPISNMKLSVGDAFQDEKMRKLGIRMSIGTDGCSSNNNLDMFEDMKVAGLLQKHHHVKPTLMSAPDIFDMATRSGAEIFGIDAGKIREGKLADLLLLDLKHHLLIPNHDLISNIVYSANGSVVDTTICNGKLLMQGRKVRGEDDIKARFAEHAETLIRKR